MFSKKKKQFIFDLIPSHLVKTIYSWTKDGIHFKLKKAVTITIKIKISVLLLDAEHRLNARFLRSKKDKRVCN